MQTHEAGFQLRDTFAWWLYAPSESAFSNEYALHNSIHKGWARFPRRVDRLYLPPGFMVKHFMY